MQETTCSLHIAKKTEIGVGGYDDEGRKTREKELGEEYEGEWGEGQEGREMRGVWLGGH